MLFAVLMMWREQNDHVTDCYLCMTKIREFSLVVAVVVVVFF